MAYLYLAKQIGITVAFGNHWLDAAAVTERVVHRDRFLREKIPSTGWPNIYAEQVSKMRQFSPSLPELCTPKLARIGSLETTSG